MKTLKYTGKFKKDLKRYQNKPKQIEALYSVLTILQNTGTVPQKYKPHFFKGGIYWLLGMSYRQ